MEKVIQVILITMATGMLVMLVTLTTGCSDGRHSDAEWMNSFEITQFGKEKK